MLAWDRVACTPWKPRGRDILMNEAMKVTRRLFNIREVAEYTGLSVHTLYTMVSQRRIPFVKAGRLVKFDLKGIDSWIEKNTVKPISR